MTCVEVRRRREAGTLNGQRGSHDVASAQIRCVPEHLVLAAQVDEVNEQSRLGLDDARPENTRRAVGAHGYCCLDSHLFVDAAEMRSRYVDGLRLEEQLAVTDGKVVERTRDLHAHPVHAVVPHVVRIDKHCVFFPMQEARSAMCEDGGEEQSHRSSCG